MEVLEIKEQRINEIFNVLVQFEKINDEDSTVTEQTYCNYLDRLYVWYLGYGNNEIAVMLKGLYDLGKNVSHSTVRRIVFHIIDILDKEVF